MGGRGTSRTARLGRSLALPEPFAPMTLDLDDTIVAIASAPGGALRGIVRLSGAGSAACVARVFRTAETGSGVFGGRDRSIIENEQPPKTPDPFHATAPSAFAGELTLPRSLGVISARLYLWPDHRSYTRQPSAELHTLGSPPLLEAVVKSLCQAGARVARPGEFTLRAFLAGRLDLTEAEAVLGVIDARGQAQLDTALAQLAGGLASPLAALRERLLDLLAHLEAGLDFVDEDIEFITPAQLAAQLAAAQVQVEQLIQRMQSRRDAGELPQVALIGLPNAGKSSLFNALAGADAAIVAEQAGTTRDYVTQRLLLDGQEFLLIDTAGIEPAHGGDELALFSQAATHRQRDEADLAIECREMGQQQAARWPDDERTLVVWTKCDLYPLPAGQHGHSTSSRTGAGIAALRQTIAERLRARAADAVVGNTAARCSESLQSAAAALESARELVAARAGEELIAAEVRAALDGLGQVAGVVYTDDVLDRVFGRFCIGK